MADRQEGNVAMEMTEMKSGEPDHQSHQIPEKDLYPSTDGKTKLPPLEGANNPGLAFTTVNPPKEPIKPIPTGKPPAKPDNSLLGFCGNFGIVILCIINAFTLLLSIGLVIIGAYVNNIINQEEEVLELLDFIDLGNYTLKQLILSVIVLIIVLGAIGILTSLMGGIGAFFTLRILLIIYALIIILCMITQLTMLGMWIDFINKIDTTIRGWFYDLLKEYKGPGVLDLYSLGWDLLFITFGCCGVNPVTSSDNDFRSLPTKWWSSGDNGNNTIPYSCCKNVATDSVRNYLNYTDIACTENLRQYHTAGCYDFFDEIFTMLATIAITVTTILFIIELVAILYSILIVWAVSVKKKVGII